METPAGNKKIRVGILLDSFNIPFWSYKMLEDIKNGSYAEIILIIKKDVVQKNSSIGIWKKRSTLIYRTYRKLDRKFFKCTPDAFERKNIRNLTYVPVTNVRVKETQFCDWIEEKDLVEIQRHKPDVLIRLGFRIIKGGILKIPKYGIWSYHHGDNSVNRGGPAGFWEVMNGEKETGVVLQILSDKLDGGPVLYKSFSLTDKVSVHRNINRYYWKALSFIPMKIKELYENGELEFFKKIGEENKNLKFYKNPLYKPPTNGLMAMLLVKLIGRELRKRISNIFYFDQWGLLYKLNKEEGISSVLYQFKKIQPPKDRIWADPHIIFKDQKYYIFIEEMLLKENKGWISVIEMDGIGKMTLPEKVLDHKYHLSYPYIFENEDGIFMIPEVKRSKTVALYKSKNFPKEWVFVKNILENVEAVDPTLFNFDNKYWLFTNIVTNKGASSHDELFLFYSDSLDSDEWVSHPHNPVISDVKKARPAGRLFWHQDQLYRPSQDCSNYYGYGIKLNKVEILNENIYRETTIDSITSDWDKRIKGIHTINSIHKLTVTDALFRRRRFF